MIFKLYDCDFGLTVRGVNYDFTDIDSVTIEDPEAVELTRGANANNTEGLAYATGTKEPKTITLVIPAINTELLVLLQDAYSKKERIESYCVSRSDGSSKMIKKAILSQKPQQLTLDETSESMNVSIILKSFDVKDNHKS